MTAYVVDASAVIDYVLAASGPLRAILREPDVEIHTPHLCDVEVAHTIRHELAAGLGAHRGNVALDDYLALPLVRHGHTVLVRRALALRHNFSAYDATYVALAERLGARLVTTDARLARAVRAQTALAVFG